MLLTNKPQSLNPNTFYFPCMRAIVFIVLGTLRATLSLDQLRVASSVFLSVLLANKALS